ncbi:MAG: DUF2760 domain-containing protein [Myxococcota bacterium]
MSFFARLKLALSILFGGPAPQAPALPAAAAPPAPSPSPEPPRPTPEAQHASALFVLGLLQREGRLLDFLQEDIAGFADADVGAAARVVHEGCRKVVARYLPVTPVVKDAEGATVQVPKGFDANRFRLTGNVTGEGPWSGALKHHGWVATKVELPEVPTSVDLKVLAPAEVEIP